MFGSRTATFDRLLEKSTSQLLLEPDWDSILGICDCIRQEDVQPKYAMSAVRKKIASDNPHVAMFALQTIESAVKNCGSLMHQEIATKENMEFFKESANKKPEPVKGKLLELIQVWSHAFRNEASYKIVQDTYNLMKMEGYNFPALKESDAMFSAERAPEWKDGEVCNRCRTGFGTFNRKHHCRACGGVFCNKCSAKSSIIPKFGIEREVRVCDSCYDTLNKAAENKEDELPAEYLASPLSKQIQGPPSKSEQELQEEEELQLALALSQSEAENQKKPSGGGYALYGGGGSTNKVQEPARAPDPVVAAPTFDTSEMDPELARYLNRNYWQQKSDTSKDVSATQPSAPMSSITSITSEQGGSKPLTSQVNSVSPQSVSPQTVTNSYGKAEEHYQGGDDSNDANKEQFLQALQGSIQIFTNRMKSNYSRGRSIANDSSVQTLFMTINQMHPQLLQFVGEQEDIRARYENLQDKLAQLKDAREALDVLREEHRETRRREHEEMERQRAIQMAHKLSLLRQKKQEYLEYQRRLALQRMEEQKRDMDMRLEQQKQMQMHRAMQYGMPSLQQQMYPGQSMSPGPGGSAEGSPMHHPHPAGPYPTHPQAMMGGAPGAPGAQMHMAGGQPMSMGMQQGMGGPPVTQAMYGGGGQPPVSLPPAGPQSYQPPGGYMPAGYHPGQPAPAEQYQPYNMHGMSASLPPGQPPVAPQQNGGMGPPPNTQPPPASIAHHPGMPGAVMQGGPPVTSMAGQGGPPGHPSMLGAGMMQGQPPITHPGVQPPVNQQHPGLPPSHLGGPPTTQYMAPGQPAPQMMAPPQPQHYMGGPAPGPPPQQQFAPGGAMPPEQQGGAQQPPPPTQGQQDIAQLISFD